MESNKEGDEIIYGPKDFTYNIKSEITTNEVKYNEKENVELIKKLSEKFNFVKSEFLIRNYIDIREKKDIEIEKEIIKEEEKLPKPVTNSFPISASKTFNLASFNVLGQKVSVKYVVGISSSKAYNKIVLQNLVLLNSEIKDVQVQLIILNPIVKLYLNLLYLHFQLFQ